MAKNTEAVNELASKLKGYYTFKDGVCTVKDDIVTAELPDGLTKDQLVAVNDHFSVFYPANAKAFGEGSIEHMKKNKSVDDISVSVPLIGKNTMNMNMSRKEDYKVVGTDKTVTHYGVLTATVSTYSADQKKSDMKVVREELREMALAALGK